jgi:carbon-monoxide dehydrogenase medium subunit
VLDARWRTGFAEVSRRAGDYGLAIGAAVLRIEDGRITEARIGVGGAADRPTRIAAAEQLLIGSDGGAAVRQEAGAVAARAIDPLEDVQASAEFRRDLVRAMVERALAQACAQ